MSSPMEFFGMAPAGTFFIPFGVFTMMSVGSIIFLLFRSSFASVVFSSSTLLLPTSCPSALKKVNIIAPPIKRASTFLSSACITPILSLTFAPPRMAMYGLFGCLSSVSSELISF